MLEIFIHKLAVWHSKKTNGRLRSFLAQNYLRGVRLRNLLAYGNKEMFHFVNIELSRKCNRRCSYCPVAKYPEFKKNMKMSFSLFAKIVDQLRKINYSGYFCFTGYYEPILCENLFDFLQYARRNLKRAQLVVYSNGDFLNEESFRIMKENSVLLIITLHEDKAGERYRRLMEISGGKNIIFKRNIEKYILSTRGGLVNVKNKEIQKSCVLPALQLTIDVEGKVILCFDDFFSQYIYGDVQKTDILEIWKGKKFQETRRAILKGRPATKICQYCFSKIS